MEGKGGVRRVWSAVRGWDSERVGAVTTTNDDDDDDDDPAGGGRSDGGLGEGHSEVLVVVQLVVVQGDQRLDGLLHRRQLHQCHLPVLPAGGAKNTTVCFGPLRGGPGWVNNLSREGHDWKPDPRVVLASNDAILIAGSLQRQLEQCNCNCTYLFMYFALFLLIFLHRKQKKGLAARKLNCLISMQVSYLV